jgi:hypothetical protein
MELRQTSLQAFTMLRARVMMGLWLGASITASGCGGGSATDNPIKILADFRSKSLDAARQEYKGKSVRLRVEKVTSVEKTGDNVAVKGKVGKIIIGATVSDAAEKTKALALKEGESAIFEGEVEDATGDVPAMGVIFLKAAKVVP